MSSSRVHDLLTAAATTRPSGTAIVDGARSITYAELESASNRLAHALVDHGVEKGDRVGLLIDKSIEALVGVYGILKAGATYVPFDESAPITRLAFIARDAQIRCLVTRRNYADDWSLLREAGAPIEVVVAAEGAGADPAEAQPPGVRVVPWAALGDYPDSACPAAAVTSDDLAYILYTSGSTGEPKGVMLSHQNALAFVGWAAREVGVGPDDRLSSHAPLHFDLSTFDLFASAWGMAPVVLIPREASVFPVELARVIRDSQISVWYSVPSILSLLVLHGGLAETPLERLRAVLFAGEVFPAKYLFRLMELHPQARFLNLFGPTETNVCTWYEVPRPVGEWPESIPIGGAIDGVELVVASVDGDPVAEGEVGELLVTGPTVMHGYWGDPARTERTLDVAGDRRTYHTGDHVRREPDGNLVFVGRRDAQIKSRGYRIELGEIETALYSLEGVTECAVIAVPDDVVTNRIKAFVTTADGALTEVDLARHCRERLPRYMVPDEFEMVGSLPKSSTGKIDRKRLTHE
jgi:amino acid adenylation domain-containing protein